MPSRRRPLRLPGYDYARPGRYFVTICAQGRRHLFGAVVGGALQPSPAGLMVARWWGGLASKFPQVRVDAFVAMPDHMHGIIVIVGADGCDAPTYPPALRCRRTALRCQRTASQSRRTARQSRCTANIAADHPVVQDHDHQRAHPRRQNPGLAAV